MTKVPLFLFGTSVASSPTSGASSVQCWNIPVLASLPLLPPGNSAFRRNRSTRKCRNLCSFTDQLLK